MDKINWEGEINRFLNWNCTKPGAPPRSLSAHFENPRSLSPAPSSPISARTRHEAHQEPPAFFPPNRNQPRLMQITVGEEGVARGAGEADVEERVVEAEPPGPDQHGALEQRRRDGHHRGGGGGERGGRRLGVGTRMGDVGRKGVFGGERRRAGWAPRRRRRRGRGGGRRAWRRRRRRYG